MREAIINIKTIYNIKKRATMHKFSEIDLRGYTFIQLY